MPVTNVVANISIRSILLVSATRFVKQAAYRIPGADALERFWEERLTWRSIVLPYLRLQ